MNSPRFVLRLLFWAVVALSAAVFVPRAAQATTYAFDFEITLTSERIFVVSEAPDGGQARVQSAPEINEWQDAAALGVSDQLGAFGLKLGESGGGTFEFADPFDYTLEVNGRQVWTLNTWIAEKDPLGGGAQFNFSMPGEAHAFDFIRWTASTENDGQGSVFDKTGTELSFLGYEASFLLTASEADIAVTPLPPAPALLLTALAGLAWMRRRRARAGT